MHAPAVVIGGLLVNTLSITVHVYILYVSVSIQLSKQMGGVVKGLDKVMQSMDLEKVQVAMIIMIPF